MERKRYREREVIIVVVAILVIMAKEECSLKWVNFEISLYCLKCVMDTEKKKIQSADDDDNNKWIHEWESSFEISI